MQENFLLGDINLGGGGGGGAEVCLFSERPSW